MVSCGDIDQKGEKVLSLSSYVFIGGPMIFSAAWGIAKAYFDDKG